MWIALILVGALAGASSINMSIRLGNLDHIGARQAGYVGIAMATCILTLFSMFLLFQCRLFFRIFSNDELYLDMFEEANVPFTMTLFFMCLAVAIERIPYAMGRTKEIFWMGLIASWGGK
jgi:Na+-driven multidrug efflux pump